LHRRRERGRREGGLPSTKKKGEKSGKELFTPSLREGQPRLREKEEKRLHIL